MADVVAEIPTEKSRGTRKALKEKTSSINDVNIVANESTISPLSENLSQPTKGKAASKKQQQQPKQQSFEQDLLEMQEKMEQLRLEKEKTEELLKAKDEILKQKDEELENRGKEQEKLQVELKKLQKLKEFKPTMVSFFISISSLLLYFGLNLYENILNLDFNCIRSAHR
jgi:upstream-binding transcription factor